MAYPTVPAHPSFPQLENEVLDAHDESAGTGTAHTANRWLFNAGRTEDPIGLLWFHL